MSGPIYMKGNAYDVAWMMRWLAGELPMDYERRRPTTTAECEAAWLRYRAITLMNTEDPLSATGDLTSVELAGGLTASGARQLNEDTQKDHDEEELGTYR